MASDIWNPWHGCRKSLMNVRKDMIIKNIPFEDGSLETMITRLYRTMNSMDTQWSKNVEPASKEQIAALEKKAGLGQAGKSIPLAYLMYLRAMGKNDNGLLEQEWDGNVEVTLDGILKYYSACTKDIDTSVYLPFLIHEFGAELYLKLTEGENPSVHYLDSFDGRTLFAGSFEKYLFQMAFRKMEKTQFLHHAHGSASQQGFQDILSKGAAQGVSWTKPIEFMEKILETCQLRKLWLSDEVHFYGISVEYILSMDLSGPFCMIISSDDFWTLQNVKTGLSRLLGNSVQWHLV